MAIFKVVTFYSRHTAVWELITVNNSVGRNLTFPYFPQFLIGYGCLVNIFLALWADATDDQLLCACVGTTVRLLGRWRKHPYYILLLFPWFCHHHHFFHPCQLLLQNRACGTRWKIQKACFTLSLPCLACFEGTGQERKKWWQWSGVVLIITLEEEELEQDCNSPLLSPSPLQSWLYALKKEVCACSFDPILAHC